MSTSPLRSHGRDARTFPTLMAVCLVLATLTLWGCRGDAPQDDLPVQVRVSTAPTPAIVGPVRMILDIEDNEGEPVEAEAVTVEGTMTHAGMVPVHDTATEQRAGRWVVPEFDFTMGGDWILIVTVRLPDGSEAIREQSLSVLSRSDGSSGG